MTTDDPSAAPAGGPGDPPLISLRGVTKRFPGVVANSDVDLELRTGETHALIGENGAGKSTLMRVLYGLYPPDEGTIEIHGTETKIASPRDAIEHGIGMVHQHFVLVDRFTVTENIVLGAEGGVVVDYAAAEATVGELAGSYGFSIDPHAVVADLSVGQRQRVEILKALYRGVEVLILDEPTAVLTPSEAGELFQNLHRLREAGKSIIFISHKLNEVLEVADRITVLRRGRVVGESTPSETSKDLLAEMMVGRPVLFRLRKPEVAVGDPVLEVTGLKIDGHVKGVDLVVRSGEILGVAGVEGNGQRELAESLIGLRAPDEGTIVVADRDLTGMSVAQIRDHGIAYIPEDRHGRGLVLDFSLWENSVLGRHRRRQYSGGGGMLAIRKIKALAARLLQEYDVRARNIGVEASTLSGGNQQKLILARELEDDPLLLIAHQPTRGLDVGAIEFVWEQILEQKAAGRAVLLISAELEEIYELSDRIVTIYEGEITGEYGPDAPPDRIGIGMTGGRRETVA